MPRKPEVVRLKDRAEEQKPVNKADRPWEAICGLTTEALTRDHKFGHDF